MDSYAKRLITTNSRTRTIYYGKDNKYIIDISRFVKKFKEEEFKAFFTYNDDINEWKFTYGAESTSKVFSLS